MRRLIYIPILLAGLIFSTSLVYDRGAGTARVSGQTREEVEGQIGNTSAKIKSLEAEIAGYEKSLTGVTAEKTSLANTVKSLDLSKKKLEAQVTLTKEKISGETLQINSLGTQIGVREGEIAEHLAQIGEMMRNLSANADASIVENVLGGSTISESLDHIYNLLALQDQVRVKVDELKKDREQLQESKSSREASRQELINLQSQLGDQKKLIEQNIRDKNALLATTKNTEANYKKLLAQKAAEKTAIEAELRSYESKLRLIINPGSLPSSGSGVLAWPLDSVSITQTFGDTEFSRSAAGAVYSGKGHNGIDLRASVGTVVKSADSGTVAGTGNTDLGCPGGSYGQWVLVTHTNGLSTLYAHLSLIKVSAGQGVGRGEMIGYSGNTGYSTGPHLHFTVYATQGVKIQPLVRADGTKSKCSAMPVSALNGYLNPLLYLAN